MLADDIESVRRFNRFYTQRIGVLDEKLLASKWSIAEVRVLRELAREKRAKTQGDIATALGLDAGYVSRMFARFASEKLVKMRRSEADARKTFFELTARGKKTFAALDRAANDGVRQLLWNVSKAERPQLVASLRAVENMFGRSKDAKLDFRAPAPGDLGWVVERNGALYAAEYGWNQTFEGLCAKIVAEFAAGDAKRQRCWIADLDGDRVGSIFLMPLNKTTARLRILFVEPRARGLGVGTKLVDECIRAARELGYRKLVLWTNDVLVDARRIYERAGFELVEKKKHRDFGPPLVAQTWSLSL
jgi:DNA-binding MarR family transcriptional regulator/ribosomal protein S18 acetylase RimI-like enzyme